MKEQVILVNERDESIGIEEKLKAHFTGVLHRAFSIFIFSTSGQMLLQKRSSTKYHSKGLWSNTCCGHPRPGESVIRASQRRLWEEMGLRCEIREIFKFIYRVKLDDNFIEHEFDHVLFGQFDGNPSPCRDEVDDWKWIDLLTLKEDMEDSPENYTYWFRISLVTLVTRLNQSNIDLRFGLKGLL